MDEEMKKYEWMRCLQDDVEDILNLNIPQTNMPLKSIKRHEWERRDREEYLLFMGKSLFESTVTALR